MANRLKMAKVSAILQLWERGWSFRRIALELGIHRDTVSGHVRAAEGRAEAAEVTLGSEGPESAEQGHPGLAAEGFHNPHPARVTLGADGSAGVEPAELGHGVLGDAPSNPAKVTLGIPASRSRCGPFLAVVKEKLEQGLTAQRIWQDLQDEQVFTGSYQSVKRFVQHLGKASPLPFRRMECAPGEEAQVDFGRGATLVSPDGRRRTSWVLRVVLSHSRKGYTEAVFRQDTETFIRVLENAFRALGGVPKVLVIDQLRAAVKHPDWFDPELNPKLEAFCRHYGVVILPTRPYTPRHKGKVERGVDYVKDNALKGRSFPSLAEENRFLTDWEARIADHRIHGTTRKQVKDLFERVERPALQPLPPDLFPAFHEAKRTVHSDGHVEVDKAYYSVPPEYLGQDVWVRWDGRLVRVFTLRMAPIAVHAQTEAGRFCTARQHIAAEKISCIERGATWLLARAARIGGRTAAWAKAVLDARGIQGMRVVQGLLSLARKHSACAIEKACESALSHQIVRLRGLRSLLKQPTTQAQFLEEHPLIRPLKHYGWFVRVSFRPAEEKEEEKTEEAFIALRADGREQRREDPDSPRAFPAVRQPAAALGSLASGALSSGPAVPKILAPAPPVNSEGDPPT